MESFNVLPKSNKNIVLKGYHWPQAYLDKTPDDGIFYWNGEAPVVCVPTKFSSTPNPVFSELEISLVIWANHMLRASLSSMEELARNMRGAYCGAEVEDNIASLEEIFRLQDAHGSKRAEHDDCLMSSDIKSTATTLLSILKKNGYSKFVGVPCSILEPLRREIEKDSDCEYFAAAHEGVAIAMAAGLWLSGHKAGVLLQNSGLGNAVNPLSSLAIPYRIPMVLIISWRGEPGFPDAFHHLPMGKATPKILDALEISHHHLSHPEDIFQLEAMELHREDGIAALLLSKQVLPENAPEPYAQRALSETKTKTKTEPNFPDVPQSPQILTEKAIETLANACPEHVVISTTGFISRALNSLGHQTNHFYMQGSMGFASAIGYGIALGKKDCPVLILDGDGALLMHMGIMGNIGRTAFGNFIHVVLDNGIYASTGGQRLPNQQVNFAGIAYHCGYREIITCGEIEALIQAIESLRQKPGTHFLHVFTHSFSEKKNRTPNDPAF